MINLSLGLLISVVTTVQPFSPMDTNPGQRSHSKAKAPEAASLYLLDHSDHQSRLLTDDRLDLMAYSSDESEPDASTLSSAQENKIDMINLAFLSAELAVGVATWWNYEDNLQAFHFHDSDGWFDQGDTWGGADKLGHAYSAYTVSRGISFLYREAGMDESKSRLYGAIAGMAMVSLIDVGDGFAQYGFSLQDVVANGVGSGLAYLLDSNSLLDRLIDFRLEYSPTKEFLDGEIDPDPFQDYSGMKFHLVLKASGIPAMDNHFLKYLELHAGYYTRDYSVVKKSLGKRHTFYGISINLSQIINDVSRTPDTDLQSDNPFATFFRYYQLPGITKQYDRSLD